MKPVSLQQMQTLHERATRSAPCTFRRAPSFRWSSRCPPERSSRPPWWDGIIKYTRGKIHILDLEALREAACECYDTVNSHDRALLGDQY
ncbi:MULTISPECIES: hypothetical protein [unclassified Bradyrhizobium]|uniref:hypothetical protein n=1 Tax=unclassified Bradyrhizobium TaxID=2631580 RepID=UPI002FF15709